MKKIFGFIIILSSLLGCSQIVPTEDITVNLVGNNLKEGKAEIVLYEYDTRRADQEALMLAKKVIEIKEDATEVKFKIKKRENVSKHYVSMTDNSEFEINYDIQGFAKVYRKAENEIKIKDKMKEEN